MGAHDWIPVIVRKPWSLADRLHVADSIEKLIEIPGDSLDHQSEGGSLHILSAQVIGLPPAYSVLWSRDRLFPLKPVTKSKMHLYYFKPLSLRCFFTPPQMTIIFTIIFIYDRGFSWHGIQNNVKKQSLNPIRFDSFQICIKSTVYMYAGFHKMHIIYIHLPMYFILLHLYLTRI